MNAQKMSPSKPYRVLTVLSAIGLKKKIGGKFWTTKPVVDKIGN